MTVVAFISANKKTSGWRSSSGTGLSPKSVQATLPPRSWRQVQAQSEVGRIIGSRVGRTTSSVKRHFPLREREDRLVERAQPVRGQRAAVRTRQVAEDPLLTLRVDEVDPARLLVRLQLRNEAQPRVDRLDERPVIVRDLVAELLDDWVGVIGHAESRLASGMATNGS